MHETIIAQQVVRVVLAEMETRGASGVRSIDLEVGQLEGLTPADLRKAFELESAGTPAEGAVLQVSLAPAKAVCPSCNQERPFELPEAHFHGQPKLVCPECGSSLELSGGRGFVVRRAAMILEDP